MFEPRGHDDMYGAILSADTELTESGEAHMGVLFTHNDGFSTMCGHATIAMGRFLVDTHEPTIFPKRKELKYDGKTKTIDLVLHAPCGPLQVTVPTTEDGWRSDPTRPVSFVSVPSFATAIDLSVCIEEKYRWPELGDRKSIAVDLAYGGAFYCVLPAASLGFPDGSKKPNLDKMSFATKQLKAAINDQSEIRYFLRHPEHRGLEYLYGIIVTDAVGFVQEGTEGAGSGLTYFADQAIDRSPTGSGVQARIALSYARKILKVGQSWTYHSLLSNACGGRGAMVGSVSEEVTIPGFENNGYAAVKVKVEGFAYYTGTSSWIVEAEDQVAEAGFTMKNLSTAS